MRRIRSTLVVIWHLLDRFVNEGCMVKAASLAYSSLLSLVPIMIAGITIISLFPQLQNYGLKIQQFIVENFVADSANVIQNYLINFVDNIRYLSWVNIFMFMVVSVLMIYNISRAFNSIWHTHNPLPLWKSIIIYFVVLFAFPILLGIGFAITAYIVGLPVYKNAILEQIMSRQMLFVLSNVVNIVLFTVLNLVLPAVKVPFRAALIAGIVTDILFEIAKYGFSIYIYHVATYRLLYGALATIPVFLVWLYVSWLTILFGTLVGHFSVVGINRRWTPRQDYEYESADFTPKKGFGE